MIDALTNRPNRILEKQRMIQASTKPNWRRLPRSDLYLTVYGGLFAVCTLGSVYSIYHLIKGKPPAEA